MGSLIGELEARQAAVRGRVEELEGQIAALTVRLEEERGRLERLTVTRETLEELAVEGIVLDASALAAEPVGGGRVVGVQTVTVWREGMTSADLPPVYRDIVTWSMTRRGRCRRSRSCPGSVCRPRRRRSRGRGAS